MVYPLSMKVIQTIQSLDPFNTGKIEPPVEIPYYTGDSLAQAISAMVQAAAADEDEKFFHVLNVRLDLNPVRTN
jgi:hypothetical protein